MKSNKQRRAEIKQLRLERAARLAKQPLVDGVRVAGREPANAARLGHVDITYAPLPKYYVDVAFQCCDCGAQEVWTAKQQKWWYEVRQAHVDSTAVRCLPCRRKRRALLAVSRAGVGANRLHDEVTWLRNVPSTKPDAKTLERVELALASKWDGVRKVAIDVLARWQRPQDAERLRVWTLDTKKRPWHDAVQESAARALAPLVRHPRDDQWVLELFASTPFLSDPFTSFVKEMDPKMVELFITHELVRNESERLENLAMMVLRTRRKPSAQIWSRFESHASRSVRDTVAFVTRRLNV